MSENNLSHNILTEKQEAVLHFIEQYQMNNGSSPTLREMREYFGVSSDNSILKHLKALEEKGFIEKDDTPRGIKLLSKIKDRLQKTEFKLPLLRSIDKYHLLKVYRYKIPDIDRLINKYLF